MVSSLVNKSAVSALHNIYECKTDTKIQKNYETPSSITYNHIGSNSTLAHRWREYYRLGIIRRPMGLENFILCQYAKNSYITSWHPDTLILSTCRCTLVPILINPYQYYCRTLIDTSTKARRYEDNFASLYSVIIFLITVVLQQHQMILYLTDYKQPERRDITHCKTKQQNFGKIFQPCKSH